MVTKYHFKLKGKVHEPSQDENPSARAMARASLAQTHYYQVCNISLTISKRECGKWRIYALPEIKDIQGHTTIQYQWHMLLHRIFQYIEITM